jgi:hypothetical protein
MPFKDGPSLRVNLNLSDACHASLIEPEVHPTDTTER